MGWNLLCINQFCKDGLLCPVADAVHPANPLQLVSSLHVLRDTFILDHLADDSVHTLPTETVGFCQMVIQLPGDDEPFIQAGTMLLKVLFAHPAIAANGLCRGCGEFKIGKVIITLQGVVDSKESLHCLRLEDVLLYFCLVASGRQSIMLWSLTLWKKQLKGDKLCLNQQ